MKAAIIIVAALLILRPGPASAQEFHPMEPIEPVPSLPSFDSHSYGGDLNLRDPGLEFKNSEIYREVPAISATPSVEIHSDDSDCEVVEAKCDNLCFPLPDQYSSFRNCAVSVCRPTSEKCIERIVDDLHERRERNNTRR